VIVEEPPVSELIRLSMSLDRSLNDRLQSLVEKSGYTNRSEFIRDMIRDRLVQDEWESDQREVVGTVTLVYDHHRHRLSEKLTDIQHDHHDAVLATTHVHLTHHLCAEMIMMKGAPGEIRRLADRLHQQKGVLHASLSLSSTGDELD
jgi:CopG family nickel-responsive transcriptional regulator